MKRLKHVAIKLGCAVLALTMLIALVPVQAKELTVQYGDSLTVSVMTRSSGACSQVDPELEKWKN